MKNEIMTGQPDSAADWEKFRPVLDEAMGELNDEDRDAVALRFLEAKPFAEIGRRLAISEEAARKRVTRALEKLHELLVRRGVTSTTAALAVALGNQAAAATPAALATSVTGVALAGAAVGGGALAATVSFMSSKLFGIGTGVVAAAAVGIAALEMNHGWQREVALAAAGHQQQTLQAKIVALEGQLQLATKRAQAADDDTASLLKAVWESRAAADARPGDALSAATSTPGPITHDMVEARYKRAQELARNGQHEAALKEFLWCYDEGMRQVSSYVGVRHSFLLSQLARLGDQYPAALTAMRERRDRFEQRLLASASDLEAAQGFGGLNRVLKEAERTFAVFEQLPTGDARRRMLASSAFDELLEKQRYSEAMEGRTFAFFAQSFERNIEERPLPVGVTDPERIRQSRRSYAITNTALNIEVLAGAGNLDQARALAGRLLAFDGSVETRQVLQRHLTRAGQSDLLASLPH